ncbi:hypothetical protein E4U60_004515 [Claviceps pazoutovae]|uniref:Uncharacterized protein n=1 Tax=Claviceps pazoutovae TaxID=1649127 RepID=A0A9P7M8M3_9HYPO|nr:hypothetical protein E4U60_004515 [Claviceps pazoutovae]
MTRSGAPHDAAADLPPPPPYEAATDGQRPHDNNNNDNDDDDDDDAREQRPFIAYSDEKSTQGSRSCSPERHSRVSAAQGAGGSFGQRTAAKSTSKNSNATPTLLCSILPSILPGHDILRTRCFASDTSPQQQRFRVALITRTILQVYHAQGDALLWELHSNSSQLVQGHQEPLQFGEGFRPSPDGSLLCVIASRGDQRQHRRLLIVDAETGWVRLEHALSATDGNKPHVSADNRMVVVLGQVGGPDSHGYLKILSLQEGDAHRPHHMQRRIRLEKPAPGQAMGIRFAPDSRHVITCAGPTKRVTEDPAPSISVCVYGVAEEGDTPRRCTRLPCSPNFNKNSSSSSSSSSSTSSNSVVVPFAVDFHFPSPQEWLVSFPDSTNPGPGRTCLVNARLGQIVAILAAPELSLSQKWQVGVSSAAPVQATEVVYDPETGLFTRMDVHSTLLPRGQTITVTKFALSSNAGRAKAVLRKALQIRAMVWTCKAGDVCALSPDGSHVLVRQGSSGSAKVDVLSVAV